MSKLRKPCAGSLDLLDEQVHRLGGPVGDAAGVEVGEQLGPPGVDGAGQAVELGDVGVGAVHQPPVQPPLGVVAGLGAVHQPQVLGGDPGGGDLPVDVADVEPGQQPVPGDVGQVFVSAAQDPPDRVQRVALAAAVTQVVLLDPAADIVDGGEPEPGDMEGVQHPGRVRQRRPQRGGVTAERVQRRHPDAVAPRLRLCR